MMSPSSNLAFDALEAKLIIHYNNLIQQLDQKYAHRISKLLAQKNKLLTGLQSLFVKQKNFIKNHANRCTAILAQNALSNNHNHHHHQQRHISVLGAPSQSNPSYSSPIKQMPKEQDHAATMNTDYSQISVNDEPNKKEQCTVPHITQKNEKKKENETKIKAKTLKRRRRQRSFKCNECNKRFLQKSELAKHAETHLTAKPFECNRCAKRFSTKQRANGHTHQRNCYLFDKGETVLALINIKLHKTKVLDRKKKQNEELYKIEYMEQGKAKKVWLSSEQCLKCTAANIERQQQMAKQAEYVLSDEKYVYTESDDQFGAYPVLCPFPCDAKLDYVEAKECYNGNSMFCNYCEQQIDESEWAYHCGKKSRAHPKGFDLCSKCAKRKAIFDHKYQNKTK